jgi:hypothetical protein
VDDLDSGESVKNDDYSIQRINVDKLNANNLFSPFAVRQNELMMLWENITESNNLIEIEKLEPGRIGPTRSTLYIPKPQ